MSRFFRSAVSSSSSSSSDDDDEELLSQDESGDEAKNKTAKPITSGSGAARPMSRFLRTEETDDSDSDSEDESDEDEDEASEKETKPKVKSRFLKDAESDESDEESVKHIVKSAKDKRLEELDASGAIIEQKIRINDWAAINAGESAFTRFRPGGCRVLTRSNRPLEFNKLSYLIQRQNTLGGTSVEPTPPVYLRVLHTLEKALSDEKEKDSRKKMDANKARALAVTRQKIKKTIKEYESEYKEYSKDADAYNAKYIASTAVAAVPKARKMRAIAGEEDEEEAFTTVGKGGRQYGVGVSDIYKTLAAIQEVRGKKVPFIYLVVYTT
jgi:translation initiation factor 3 subunit C